MRTVVSLVLASAVATGGTFTVGYPTGKTRGNFLGGVGNAFTALQTLFVEPTNFTCSYGSSSVTVTYNGATTLPAGTAINFELDEPGVDNYQSGSDGNPMTGVVPGRLAFVSLGSPIATVDNNLRAAAAVGGAGALTLLISQLDVPRNLIITSSGNDSGITFTVVSTDFFGKAMSEVITGANAGVAAGVKAHYKIVSITASGAAAGTVKIGVGNVLGLPVFLPNAAYILKELLNGAAATAGTTVAGLSPNTKSTTTTADVRGTYVPNSAPDGSKAYVLVLALADYNDYGNPQA